MERLKKHKAIFLLSALYLFTRILALLKAGSFWFDEAFSVKFSSLPVGEMWGYLQFEHNPLAHFLSLHYWMNSFGSSEVATRSLSVFAGFLTLLVLYFLSAKLFNKRVGFWAGFIMILSTFQLYHQTEARMYALVGLFAAATIYSFWSWFEDKKFLWLILYGLSAALLVHTHLTAWALLVALWLFWIFEAVGDRERLYGLYSWLIVNALIVMSFLAWFLPVFRNKAAAGHVSNGWFLYQIDDGFWLGHITNFLLNGEPSMLVRSAGALLLIVLLLLSIVSFDRPSWWQKIKSLFDHSSWPFSLSVRWTIKTRFLLACFLIPLLIGFALQITVTKYLLAACIPLFILLGLAIAERKQRNTKVVIALLLIAVTLPMHVRFYSKARHNWDKAAHQLNLLSQQYPEAAFISHSFAWALPLEFYNAPKVTPFYPLRDELSFEERAIRYNWQAIVNHDNVSELSDLIKDAPRVILISSTPGKALDDPVKNNLWSDGWQLKEEFNWPGYGDPQILVFVK